MEGADGSNGRSADDAVAAAHARPPGHPLEPSVLRVHRDDGRPCGVACLVDADTVATCAHVVAEARGIPAESTVPPEGRVVLQFPFLGNSQVTAQVTKWVPDRGDGGDVALLHVVDPLPAGAKPAELVAGWKGVGNTFDVYGFPRYGDEGRWSYGVLRDRVGTGWMQIEDTSPEGYRIEPGFSGSPVWDKVRAGVAGLVVRSETDASARAAFLIPTEMLSEPRRPGPRLAQTAPSLTDGLHRLPGGALANLQRFLVQYLGTPARPAAFGGREDELRQLDDWVKDEDDPYGLLVAVAGRGKSALVAQWANRIALSGTADVALVPISIRFGTTLKSTVFAMLGARLRFLRDVGGEAPADWQAWASEIEATLLAPREDNEPLLVILDGADEAAGWELGDALRFPAIPGRGVKVLVTARQLADRDAEDWLRHFQWEGLAKQFTLAPLDESGIGRVLRALGEPLAGFGQRREIVRELTRLSAGDPLLVRLFVDQIRTRAERGLAVTPHELRGLEPGIVGYFRDWWDDQREQWAAAGRDPDREEEQALELLNLCAVAFGPVSLDELVAILGRTDQSGLLLRRKIAELVGRFLVETDDGAAGYGYVLSHPRLGEYFRGEMLATERRAWDERFVAFGRRAIEQVAAGDARGTTHPYTLRYFSAHLKRLGAPARDLDLLVSESWMRASEALDGSHEGFLVDVDHAWEAVDGVSAASTDTDERGWAVGRQVRYALVRSSILSLVASVPPALLARLVEDKVWTPDHALNYARRAPDDFARARALAELTPVLPPETLGIALDEAQQLGSPEIRAAVLAELAGRLPEHLAAVALGIASDLEAPAARAQALAALAPVLPQTLIREALVTSSTLPPPHRAVAAKALIAALPDEEQAQALAETVDDADELEPAERTRMLAVLFDSLPEHRRHDAVEKILAGASGIESSLERVEILLQVASDAPEGKHADLMRETFVDLIESDFDPYEFAAAARLIPDELVGAALDRALALDDSYERAIVLQSLAPRLSADALIRAFDSFAGDEPRDVYRSVLAQLASLGRQDEVLARLRRLAPSRMMDALPYVVAADPESLLSAGLALAESIEDEIWRSSALASLIPAVARAEGAEEALRRVASLSGSKGSAIENLAPELPEHLLGEALAPARALERFERPDALAALAKRLGEVGKHREAVDVIAEIPDSARRSRLIEELAPKLTAELLVLAASISRTLGDEEAQARTLIAFATELSPNAGDGLLEQAMAAAAGVEIGRATLVESIAAQASERLFERLLTRAADSDDDATTALLAGGLQNRAAGVRDRATAVVLDRAWTVSEVSVLLRLALLAPESVRHNLLDECDRLVSGETDAALRSETLTEIAAHHSAYRRTQLLERAASEARLLADSVERANALAAVAKVLPPEQRDPVAREALDAAAELEENVSYVVAGLPGPLSTPVAERAVALARSLTHPRERARALVASVRLFEQPRRDDVSREALAAIAQIPDRTWKSITLAELASTLPEALVHEGLQLAAGIERYPGGGATSALAARLAELGRGDEALDVVAPEGWSARVLQQLEPFLDDVLFERALALARAAPPHEQRAAGAVLARRLAALGRGDEAFEAACSADAYTRTDALEAVVAQVTALPLTHLARMWRDAIHRLSFEPRDQLLKDLAALAPVVRAVGGESALLDAASAVRELGSWFGARASVLT